MILKCFIQDLAASLVDDPGCRSNLRVIVSGEVFHQEIHKAAFLLEKTEKGHNFGLGLVVPAEAGAARRPGQRRAREVVRRGEKGEDDERR